jgi:hypothetical protein
MLRQEKHTQVLLGLTILGILIFVSISGCTSIQNKNQNTNEASTQLSGTWAGSMEMPMSNGRGNTSISQITFMGNTAKITLESTLGSFTMNYTFTMNGNTLVLEPNLSNRGEFPGRIPQNGTRPWNGTARPPMNETWPVNSTHLYNGTRPSNWTQPENGTWNPGGGQRSLSVSFSFSMNEDHTLLFLNGAEFRKVQ